MSTSIRHASLAQRLSATLRPADVYAALVEWTQNEAAPAVEGIYLATHDGGFARDDDGPAGSIERLSETRGATEVDLIFRDRPLGRVRFEGALPDPEHVAEVQSDLPAALFRALYLSDTAVEIARTREQLHYLDGMAKFLAELDLDTLLVNVLELTTSHLGADLGSITLIRGEEIETAVDWGLPHEAITALELRNGESVLRHAFDARKPQLLGVDDLQTHGDERYRFEHLVVLPLCTVDAVWGSINLVFGDDTGGLGAEALESIHSGVALAAIAVENALLLEIKLASEREQEQLKLGQQIQGALLPRESPHYDGLDVAGSSVSATMIGGDYFDYFDLPDGRLGLVVADVAGKGVAAGLIMTATRAMFRAAASNHADPASVIGEVNRLLCAEDFGSRFVTAIFVALDARTGLATYACAGHDAPIKRNARGSIEEITSLPALPLGLRAEMVYEQRHFQLEVGEMAMLFTDGVSEAMDVNRQQFGIERIHSTLIEAEADSAQEALRAVVSAVDLHCAHAPRHDDTTLIVVRRHDATAERNGHGS